MKIHIICGILNLQESAESELKAAATMNDAFI